MQLVVSWIKKKGWTLVTLSFMVYVIEIKTVIKLKNYILYGQGDSQVIMFKIPSINENDIPKEIYLKEFIKRIRNNLGIACNEIGLTVILQETWFSGSFFQYSKDFYIHGARMSLDMKQLLAISPHTKLIVPTQFDLYIMMISTVNACFDLSHSILATYYIGMFITNSLILVDDHTYDRRPELAYISNMNSTYEPRRLIYAGGSLLLEMMSKIPS